MLDFRGRCVTARRASFYLFGLAWDQSPQAKPNRDYHDALSVDAWFALERAFFSGLSFVMIGGAFFFSIG
jgi:hypothetical protein